MLTPAFELSQNGTTVTVHIKAPFAKVSDAEIYIDGFEFKFYSKPYFLRLQLPGEIVENGSESAKYDTDKGYFTVHVPKATPGEHFEGLDMLTKLLAPPGKDSAKSPLIEVVATDSVEASCHLEKDNVEDEDCDWHIEQEIHSESVTSITDPKYGFASQRSGVFKQLQSELHGVIDLPNADQVPEQKRHLLRVADEQEHFDDDHYLADLYEDDMIKEVLAYRPHYVDEYDRVSSGASPEEIVDIPDDLKEKMLKLPRKEFILDKAGHKEAMLGLIDLIFAYAYNKRTTEGENTVESSWVIAKLSTMLSWLDSPKSVKSAVEASCRRCLCYPIYRNWKLVRRLLKDVQRIFVTGRRCILRCLLEMHSLLQDTDSRYILNDLYMTDYCVWIQSVREKHIRSLAKSLSEVKLEKGDLGLDLEILEQAATLAIEEDGGEESTSPLSLVESMQRISLEQSSTRNQQDCNSEQSAGVRQDQSSTSEESETDTISDETSESEDDTLCNVCSCETAPYKDSSLSQTPHQDSICAQRDLEYDLAKESSGGNKPLIVDITDQT